MKIAYSLLISIYLTQAVSATPTMCVASDVSRMSVTPYVSNVDFVAPDDSYLKFDIISNIGSEGFDVTSAYRVFKYCRAEWVHTKVLSMDSLPDCDDRSLGLVGEHQKVSEKYQSLSFADFYKKQVCGKRDLGKYGNVTIDIITDLRFYGSEGCDAWNTAPENTGITNSLTEVGLYETCSDFSAFHGSDTDGDGIPDFYDDDIDGDAFTNILDICPHGESSGFETQNIEIDRPGFLACGPERIELNNYLHPDTVEFTVLGEGKYSSNLVMPSSGGCIRSEDETRVYREILDPVSRELIGLYDDAHGVQICSTSHESGFSGFSVYVHGPDNDVVSYEDSIRGDNVCVLADPGGDWSHRSFSVKAIDSPQQDGCN